MRKALFIVPFLAAVLAGCSQHEEPVGDQQDSAVVGYLSVTLQPTSAPDTRAVYEDGTGLENKVNLVRFFFFDQNGNAAAIKSGSNGKQSYSDWVPTDSNIFGGDPPNIEKRLATVEFAVPRNEEFPSSVVAILNPTAAVKAMPMPSLNDLLTLVEDYSLEATGDEFVMSNTIFMQDGKKVIAVDVAGYIADSREAAQSNPAVIYVERVLAKIRLGTSDELNERRRSINRGGNIFTIYPTEVAADDGSGAKYYVRLLGWDVTGTSNISRLIKELNVNWPYDLFGYGLNEPWNNLPYRRSHWAINPDPETTGWDVIWKSFGSTTENAIQDFVGDNGMVWQIYVQENAARYTAPIDQNDGTIDDTKRTSVVIAAQIVDGEGSPVEFGEWDGQRYGLDDLKKMIANAAREKYALYKQLEGEAEAEGYLQIEDTDLTFVKVPEVAGGEGPESGRYYVCAQLTDAAKAKKWFVKEGEATFKPAEVEQLDEWLQELGPVKIWSNGYTYYTVPIRHLGAVGYPGEFGIVRNHIYEFRIRRFRGLGTPVYDVDDPINPDPEDPEDPDDPDEPEDPEDEQIVLEIKVLPWRMVFESFEFDWNPDGDDQAGEEPGTPTPPAQVYGNTPKRLTM